jgi:DinB superfamily
MGSSRDDLIGLFEYVWQRFSDRMDGLTDAEWKWEPIADDRVTLRWRLQHITEFLRAERNGPWLGLAAEPTGEPPGPATSAAAAMWDVSTAYAKWHGLLSETTDESLGELIGSAGGRYGDATRRAFALHIIDELVHHTAEAALLRDMYAGHSQD